MADPISNTVSKLQQKENAGRTIITVILLLALGGTAFYFWGLIVPFVLDVIVDTTKLVIACFVLAGLLYVVLDPRMRMLVLYGYRSFTRFLTGQFVEIDPIGILNTYVSRLQERLAEMDQSIGTLRGQRDKLKDTIQKNESSRLHNMSLAKQAQKQGGEMHQEIALHARQAGRLEKSNLTLQNLLDRMEKLLSSMMKMREYSAMLCEDIKGEVDVKTAERKALLAGYNAFSKARAIMAGGGAEHELFDITMEKLADDYANKMGEIEGFLDMSKSVINGMDLENGVYEEKALAELTSWEEKGSHLLSAPPPKVRVDAAPPQGDFAALFSAPSETQQNKTGQN